jgi:hypothetical protein
MSSSKKMDLHRDFAVGAYLSVAQNPLPLPSLHNVYVYTVYLFTQGRWVGGNKSWTRGKVRWATFHKAGSKIPTWLTVSPVKNSDKHLPQSPFTGQFFRWWHFALVSIKLISSWCTLSVTHEQIRCHLRLTQPPSKVRQMIPYSPY